tara:strand:- start:1046 stop:1261 length:216 start_codon:yes stop_codon:yes gene_type:complete
MIKMTTPVILIKKVYAYRNPEKLEKYKPVNKYAIQVLNLLGEHREYFTIPNIKKLEALDFQIEISKEGLYD